MMNSIAEVEVKGKKVLVRLDLDVPVENGEVGDLTRLQAALATLRSTVERGGQPIILGHAGRPEGKMVESMSLRPILEKLMELLGGDYIYEIIDQPMPSLGGTIFALENLRFNAGEEANDPEFAKYLASFGEMYVNDAFAVSHRAHASLDQLPKLLPHYAGVHLIEEVTHLEAAIKSPAHPVVLILGGAKVETKLPVVEAMDAVADQILLGGKLVKEADPVTLPTKVVLAALDETGFDIDAASRDVFVKIIAQAQTIIWNGPVGKFEESPYDAGTKAVAVAVAANTGANRVIGGGDTLAALSTFGLLDKVGYVSTGGGAMLDFLAGEKLPGLVAIGY
jgi:phosphoglycerate kinase